VSIGIDPNKVLSGTLSKIVIGLLVVVFAALGAWLKKTVLGDKIAWSKIADVELPASVRGTCEVGGVTRVWITNRGRTKAERLSLITSSSIVAVRIDPVLDYELTELDGHKILKISEIPKKSKFAIDLYGMSSSPYVRSIRLDGDEITETRFEKIAGENDIVLPPWYTILFWLSTLALVVQMAAQLATGFGLLPEIATAK